MAILKDVPGEPGFLAGNDGTVWRRSENGELSEMPVYCPTDDKHYCRVTLSSGRKDLHVVVLETFRGPCPPGLEGCHNDGNKLNNYLDNLRWDSRQNNILDTVRHGTHAQSGKVSQYERARIKELYRNDELSQKALAEVFGISRSAVRKILHEEIAARKEAKVGH